MEVKVDMDFKAILKLISQLPDEKAKELFSFLKGRLHSKNTGGKNDLKKLVLAAPTWDDAQFNLMQEARDSINSSRLA